MENKYLLYYIINNVYICACVTNAVIYTSYLCKILKTIFINQQYRFVFFKYVYHG